MYEVKNIWFVVLIEFNDFNLIFNVKIIIIIVK